MNSMINMIKHKGRVKHTVKMSLQDHENTVLGELNDVEMIPPHESERGEIHDQGLKTTDSLQRKGW